MRLVKEKTKCLAIHARDLFDNSLNECDFSNNITTCSFFTVRNNKDFWYKLNKIQSILNSSKKYYERDEDYVDDELIVPQVSITLHGVNCSFFGVVDSSIYDDKIVKELFDYDIAFLNDIDSYNKESDLLTGKIENYSKKYVKLATEPELTELVVNPTTYRAFFRYHPNIYSYYITSMFNLERLKEVTL